MGFGEVAVAWALPTFMMRDLNFVGTAHATYFVFRQPENKKSTLAFEIKSFS